LEEEGFLEALPGGGYAVKTFTEQDAFDAIEIRGALEGLAARLAAERGVDEVCLKAMDGIIHEIDAMLAKPVMSPEDFSTYSALNETLHQALAEASGAKLLARQIERAQAMPFAHPSGFVMAQGQRGDARVLFILAQDHHRSVVEAIRNREGSRAEAVMREHARLAARNLRLAMDNQRAMGLVAGAQLLRGVGAV
jgi:GntR family transcriptional regulator of vanillate catabolism